MLLSFFQEISSFRIWCGIQQVNHDFHFRCLGKFTRGTSTGQGRHKELQISDVRIRIQSFLGLIWIWIRTQSLNVRIQGKRRGFGFSWIRIRGGWIRIRIWIRDAWIRTSLLQMAILHMKRPQIDCIVLNGEFSTIQTHKNKVFYSKVQRMAPFRKFIVHCLTK